MCRDQVVKPGRVRSGGVTRGPAHASAHQATTYRVPRPRPSRRKCPSRARSVRARRASSRERPDSATSSPRDTPPRAAAISMAVRRQAVAGRRVEGGRDTIGARGVSRSVSIGKSWGVSRPCPLMIIASSTTASSSRTFPGHACPTRRSRADAVAPSTKRPYRALAWRRTCSTKSGMSPRRSRRGMQEVLATFPCPLRRALCPRSGRWPRVQQRPRLHRANPCAQVPRNPLLLGAVARHCHQALDTTRHGAHGEGQGRGRLPPIWTDRERPPCRPSAAGGEGPTRPAVTVAMRSQRLPFRSARRARGDGRRCQEPGAIGPPRRLSRTGSQELLS